MTMPTDDELLRVYYTATRAECEKIRNEVFPWSEGGAYKAVIQEAERIDRAGAVAVKNAVIEALAAEAESIAAAVADSAWNTTADWLRGHLGDTEATDE